MEIGVQALGHIAGLARLVAAHLLDGSISAIEQRALCIADGFAQFVSGSVHADGFTVPVVEPAGHAGGIGHIHGSLNIIQQIVVLAVGADVKIFGQAHASAI